MARPECDRSENVVRAVSKGHWDEGRGRIQSSLFEGAGLSVSRLEVLGLTELLAIFRTQLGPPPQPGFAALEINVGDLQDIALGYGNPVHVTVEVDPLPENPAHAEIPQKITRGLAKKILQQIQRIHPAQ
jgi:hypothetical protein